MDLRYSRFIPLRAGQTIEAFVEAKNLFNTLNIAGVSRVVTTDALGVPAIAVPTPAVAFAGASAYDQRIMQLGIKCVF